MAKQPRTAQPKQPISTAMSHVSQDIEKVSDDLTITTTTNVQKQYVGHPTKVNKAMAKQVAEWGTSDGDGS